MPFWPIRPERWSLVSDKVTEISPGRPGPDMSSSVRANTPWILATSASVAAGSFIQFALVARILGPTGAGQYSLALAVAAPLTLFLGLSLRNVLQAKMAVWTDYREILGLRIFLSLTLIVCCAGLASFIPSLSAGVLIIVASTRAADLLLDLSMGVCLRSGRPGLAGAPVVASQALGITLFWFLLATRESLAVGLLGPMVASWVMAILTTTLFARSVSGGGKCRPLFGLRRTWFWFRKGLPLGAASSVNSLSVFAPRYALAQILGPQAVGEYSAALAIASVPGIIYSAIAQSGLTPIIQASKVSVSSGRRLAARLLGVNVAVAVLCGVPMLLAPESLLMAVFGEAFATSTTSLALRILAVTSIMVAMIWILDVVLIGRGLFRAQLATTVISVSATVAASVALIGGWGVAGAAMAAAVGYLAGFVAKVTFARGSARLGEGA